MADLLNSGSKWFQSVRAKHCITLVQYLRGSDSDDILATLGRTIFKISEQFGQVRYESRDFIVAVEDFPYSDEPEPGDRVVEGGCAYEVMAPGGEPCWRFGDLYRRSYRIHAKRIGDV